MILFKSNNRSWEFFINKETLYRSGKINLIIDNNDYMYRNNNIVVRKTVNTTIISTNKYYL